MSVNSNPVVNNTDGSLVGYKYFNFDATYGKKGLKLLMNIVPQGVKGKITIYAGNPKKGGKKVGTIRIKKNMKQELTEVKACVRKLKKYQGKQALFFAFSSTTPETSICEMHDFVFASK